MDPLPDPVEVVAFVSALLVLLLHIQDALQQAVGCPVLNMQEYEALETIHECHDMLQALNASATASLHCFWLLNSQFLLAEDMDSGSSRGQLLGLQDLSLSSMSMTDGCNTLE
jgi:hypothetical protein